MKNKVLKLLNSSTLKDYLSGIQLLTSSLNGQQLLSESIDAKIIDRLSSVFVFEQWAIYKDYFINIKEFSETIPKYQFVLNDTKVKKAQEGLFLFTNGLLKHTCDVTGFPDSEHSGFLISQIHSKSIADFLKNEGDESGATFYYKMSDFYKQISLAQFQAAQSISLVESWNMPMLRSYFQIILRAETNIQKWMIDNLELVKGEQNILDYVKRFDDLNELLQSFFSLD